MGNTYTWTEPCPNCGCPLKCYYDYAFNLTDVKCWECGKRYDMVLTFKLREKKEEEKKMTEEQAKYCHVVKFRGGQILIFENETHGAIEIRTSLGWRLGKPCGLGKNDSKKRGIRIGFRFSEKRKQEDFYKMEQAAAGRDVILPKTEKIENSGEEDEKPRILREGTAKKYQSALG